MGHLILVLGYHLLGLVQVTSYSVVGFDFVAYLLSVLTKPKGADGLFSLSHRGGDAQDDCSPRVPS